MIYKIREYVEKLFESVPPTRKSVELKEELIMNLEERYQDLIEQGHDPQSAYSVVISGIGNIDELLYNLKEPTIFNQNFVDQQRRSNAFITAFSVLLYIIAVLSLIVSTYSLNDPFPGLIVMFLIAGFATFLLIYNHMRTPQYIKQDETIIEEFKEWNNQKTKQNSFSSALQGFIWMIAILVFFLLGFFADGWSYAWLVFIVTGAISQIIKLSSMR